MLLRYFLMALTLICLSATQTGCIRPYKIGVWQGNALEQKAIETVKVGMTKEQVHFLLGTPMSNNPFDNERWDYLYLYQPGNAKPYRRLISIIFDGDKVTRIEGDIKPPEKPDEGTEALDIGKKLPTSKPAEKN